MDAKKGRFSGTDPFTEAEVGSVVTISGDTYAKLGTGNTDAILAE